MKQINSNIESFTKYIQSIQKYTEPMKILKDFTDSYKVFQNNINSSLLELNKTVENINKLNSSIYQPLNILREQGNFYKRIQEIVEKTPISLLKLAEHGWYLEYESDFSLPVDLAELIENNEIDKLDDFLISFYSENFERIINDLCKRHTKREIIFRQIDFAHKNKMYYVSIPSIITQVDGISYDFTKKKFFIKDKTTFLPEISNEISKISNSTIDLFLSPLKNQTPIGVHSSKINSFPSKLNRHEILHGNSTSYGAEINSLKCLSLLKYISDIFIQLNTLN